MNKSAIRKLITADKKKKQAAKKVKVKLGGKDVTLKIASLKIAEIMRYSDLAEEHKVHTFTVLTMLGATDDKGVPVFDEKDLDFLEDNPLISIPCGKAVMELCGMFGQDEEVKKPN